MIDRTFDRSRIGEILRISLARGVQNPSAMVGYSPLDADEELRPGSQIKPNLILERPLADGGMGSVWIARQISLGIPVAVKFLRGSLVAHPVARTRFRREAAAAARIRSPHVVQILDYDVTPSGRPYIVMELLEGETLGARLMRRGTLDVEATLSVTKQICLALARAHDVGIVHRDIKPENLFLLEGADELFVKILDFGVAKDVTAHTMTTAQAIIGTPQFMAPEQMAGLDIGPEADVWSIGVVAYCCVTGKLPFDGQTFVGMAAALEKGLKMVPPSKLDPLVPTPFEDWLGRALEPDPSRRLPHARALLEAIEASLPKRSPAPSSQAAVHGTVPAYELAPTVRIDKRRAVARRKKLLQGAGAAVFGISISAGIWVAQRPADLLPDAVHEAKREPPAAALAPRAAATADPQVAQPTAASASTTSTASSASVSLTARPSNR
ncbi:MAG: serine/threonine protein kinase [Polyangiaceae bacterium]|nr:serine/threonine protein kinase [Polyangiaceae bacterium]